MCEEVKEYMDGALAHQIEKNSLGKNKTKDQTIRGNKIFIQRRSRKNSDFGVFIKEFMFIKSKS